ncbi:MAG: biotin--[acetyl-CoA-carboxylase] ligase [Vicingaceae bacterium]|jgi:BirA family biotin operon repressor/biotin-[acetyl-CoA-carboxylase] ligase
MYQRLFLGNKTLKLKEVNSTNSYLKELISSNYKELEGLVVVAENQFSGRGQKGSVWESESGQNLTFSILLKPNIPISKQFIISKTISLGIIAFLNDLGLNVLKIKWPNDIYCNDKKIAGILIENSINGNNINSSVVGIGLNVNQINFHSENSPTSIAKELMGDELNLDELLNQLLFFIEKIYTDLKLGKETLINANYTNNLYWINEYRSFRKGNELIEGTILGVNESGKLQLQVNNVIETFGLKEIAFFR